MRELLRTIEQAVRARGWSARQASVRAVGTPGLITNMRRGRVPSVERLRALCEVLDLEFYVGPYRGEELEVDEHRLSLALEATERGLSASGRRMEFADKAHLVAAVYQLIGKERGAADAERLRSLIGIVAGAGREDDGPERLVRMAKARKKGSARASGERNPED